jgi:formate C-acetyltransferase
MTLGGVDKYGNDATKPRHLHDAPDLGPPAAHDPPQALRIHKNTPPELWEAAIETTKRAGGVRPSKTTTSSYRPDEPGLSLESARN